MGKEQLLANSLECVGHRITRALKEGKTDILTYLLEDITKTLNEFYEGQYTYFDR